MYRKGFTLMETILGLFILGLIGITTLTIVNSSFISLRNQEIKLEMMYIGEMAIERIKAYKEENDTDLFIYDLSVSDLIQSFRLNDSFEVNLNNIGKNEEFSLKIIKSEKSSSVWILSVYVYCHKEGSNISNVEYKAYLPKK